MPSAPTTPEPRVLIVGAGIGGLTLAQAMQRRGLPFDLIEKIEAPKAVGAGITLPFNALRLLDALGLGPALRRVGLLFTVAQIVTSRGQPLQTVHMSALHPNAEGLALHRADLHHILQGGQKVEWNTTVTKLRLVQGGMQVTLSTGHVRQYALVIGADGLHSSTRTQVFGPVALRYAGYTCWRFVTPSQDGLVPIERWDYRRRVGLHNLGGGQCYGYGTLSAPAGRPDPPAGRAERVQQLFAGMGLPTNLQDHEIIHDDLYELPRHYWQRGRVALLGDAAHAMTPNLGQGAALAIEDAIVLTECLYKHGLTEQALELYVRVRRARAKATADTARLIGRLAHLPHPALCQMRDLLLGAIPQPIANQRAKSQFLKGAPGVPLYE